MLIKNTISSRDLQRNYKQVVNQIKKSDQPMVVLSRNKAQFALINLDLLEKYRRKQAFSAIEEIQKKNKDVDFETAYRDITEAVEEVRQEMYGRQTKNRP